MEFRTITITEVNTKAGIIAGLDEYQQKVLVSNHLQDGLTIVPKKDERWLIFKDGAFWFLWKKQETTNFITRYRDLDEGDGRIEVNDLHINGNVKINGEELEDRSVDVKVDGEFIGKSKTLNLKSNLGIKFNATYNSITDEIDVYGYFRGHKDQTYRLVHEPGYGDVEFVNSWVNYDTVEAPAGFMIDALGFVHLQGLVKSGTGAPSTIFTLPQSYWPSRRHMFSVIAGPGGARVDVTSTGNVSLANYFATGSNIYVQLSGIIYPSRSII